jgi:hypothetical protein
MTLDTADDLEALEDRIGVLQSALQQAAEIIHSHHHHSWKKDGERWIDLPLGECGSTLCQRYSALASEVSERPTCDDEICDETCGSPHHSWNRES